MNYVLQNILNRLSKLHLAILISLSLSALFAVIGLTAQLSPSNVAPLSGVVIEETLAENHPPTPAPIKPSEEQHGWTAWSG